MKMLVPTTKEFFIIGTKNKDGKEEAAFPAAFIIFMANSIRFLVITMAKKYRTQVTVPNMASAKSTLSLAMDGVKLANVES